MKLLSILTKFYLTTLMFILSTSYLVAQDLLQKPKETVKPVMLFKKAQDLISNDKHSEAKTVLEKLVREFPNDFEIRGLYLEAIGISESDRFYKEKALEALELYKQVPITERTQNFYERYSIVLRDLKKTDEMLLLKDEIVRKFPSSRMAIALRVREASNEEDIVRATELFELIEKDLNNNFGIYQLYESYFSRISKDLSNLDKEKVISVARKYEESRLNAQNDKATPENFRTQKGYIKTLLELSDKLREKVPAESLQFAQKGLNFINQPEADEEAKSYKITLQEAVFSSYLALEDWKNAREVGLEIVERTKNASSEFIDEARIHRDYAIALEKLKQIPRARAHFYIASLLDKKFEKDWEDFDSRQTLFPDTKAKFKKSTEIKLKRSLDSREAFLRSELLNTELDAVASDFRIEDVNGKTLSLKDYEGKVLVLNFWATWCQPCIGELELMKTVYKKYANNPKVAFAFVSTDEMRERVPIVAGKRGYEFPIFYSNEKLESDYETNPIPRMIIINPTGKIKFSTRGFRDNGYYLKELDWMIEAAMKSE